MSKRPSHHLNLVTEHPTKEGESKRRFHEIAPLWTTENGNLSGEIPAGMAITGRLLITTAKVTTEQSESDTADTKSHDGLSDT